MSNADSNLPVILWRLCLDKLAGPSGKKLSVLVLLRLSLDAEVPRETGIDGLDGTPTYIVYCPKGRHVGTHFRPGYMPATLVLFSDLGNLFDEAWILHRGWNFRSA